MTNSILKEKNYNLDINKYKSIVSSHKELQKNLGVGSTEIERNKTFNTLAKSFSETNFAVMKIINLNRSYYILLKIISW